MSSAPYQRLSRTGLTAVGGIGWFIVLTTLYPVVVNKNGEFHQKFDAWIYYYATKQWAEGGALYDFYAFPTDHLYPFTYPPFAAWVMRGLTLFSFDHAQVFLSFLTVAATAWSTWLTLRLIGVSSPRSTALTPWISAGAVLTLEPFVKTLEYGQINAILMALVLTDLWGTELLPAHHPLRRIQGVGCAIAACIKITPAIAILVFIIRRQWRAVGVMVGSSIAITAATALISPDESRQYFFTYLWDPSRTGEYTYAGNQNLMGAFARFFPPSAAFSAWGVASAMLLVFVLRACWQGWSYRSAEGENLPHLALTTCIVMLYGLLVSPITWSHHWVWMLPAIMVAAWLAIVWNTELWLWISGAGLIVAWLAPHWWWPEHGDRETTWPLWAQFLGSSSTWWALLFLIAGLRVYAVGSRHNALHGDIDL